MDYGFVRTAAFTPKIKVADTKYNTDTVKKLIDEAVDSQVRIAVFPELCITGYTCSDLFLQTALLKSAVHCTEELAEYTKDKDIAVLVGLPFMYEGKLYNVAAVLAEGEVKGLIPKRNLPNYGEFYEARHFHRGFERAVCDVHFGKFAVPFGMNLLFRFPKIENLVLAAEICEDLWVPLPPSVKHATAGATVIANLSAGDETTGKAAYRKSLVTSYSASLICGYIYASAGEGESSTDMVFSGHNLIAENGNVLAEARRFFNQSVTADIDVDKLVSERRRMTTYPGNQEEDKNKSEYLTIDINIQNQRTDLKRFVDSMPFVPSDTKNREMRCEEILMLQAMGLKKRLEHTNCRHAVIGISGGLDSTLALLVTVKAFDLLGIDRSGILAVTMPGFGTTDRTYDNALKLIQKTDAELKEINISRAVRLHFEEIGHDEQVHDVTYENSQARQRTLLLMDLANKVNGMVVGTGDLSELALGWATYNGDHMSMYAVNSSVPKTLVRYLVQYYADTCGDASLKETLYDILNTPVSPELLPPDESGKIAQKTEDLVGPYELHDFFLYNMLRNCYEPAKIYYLACHAFCGCYEPDVILKWLKVFYKRFFAQQFKRSCIPDGVKVGSVTVSPRGDLRMPSDACAAVWLSQLDLIES